MVGTIIQGLIIINNEDYVFQAWHGTLLSIAVMRSYSTLSSPESYPLPKAWLWSFTYSGCSESSFRFGP